MAENIPGGNQSAAEDVPQGHRTIKLTPLNVKPVPGEGAAPEQPENTSTIKINSKVSLKPKAAPPSVSPEPSANPPPAGMDTKTQAVPLKGFKKAGAPISLNSTAASAVRVPAPGSTTTVLSPKPGDTETKGIPLSGVASVPQHESAEDVQTSTVKLNRPSPKPMSTHSAPISTQSGSIPATPTRKMPIPTVTAPMKTAPPAPGSPTIRLGATPAAAQNATSTTGIKLTGMPTKVSTSTTGIKLGSTPPAAKVPTSTTNIKLDGTPAPAAATTVRLDSPAPAPASGEKVSTSTTGIKLGGVPAPAASTVKLGAPAVPASPVAPSLSIKKNAPEPAPAPAPAGEAPAAEAPAEAETAKKKVSLKKKKDAASGGEPHILFAIWSSVALIAVILLTAVVVIQYLNHWEGMQIQVPGLEFLTLGK